MSDGVALLLFPVQEELIHREKVPVWRDIGDRSAMSPWVRVAMVLDSITSEDSMELVTPDTSKPLPWRALCMAVIEAARSCSTDTTEVTMLGETHLICAGHESCMTALMVETQVGQCRLARRNEVVIGSAACRPAVCDDAILTNTGRLAFGSNGVLAGSWACDDRSRTDSHPVGGKGGKLDWRCATAVG
jgi:hypothetical protein